MRAAVCRPANFVPLTVFLSKTSWGELDDSQMKTGPSLSLVFTLHPHSLFPLHLITDTLKKNMIYLLSPTTKRYPTDCNFLQRVLARASCFYWDGVTLYSHQLLDPLYKAREYTCASEKAGHSSTNNIFF